MWRLVLEQIATLEEIERSWNFMDIMKANALLDYRADLLELRSKAEKTK